MTLYQFIQLSKEAKHTTLSTKGVFVDSLVIYSNPNFQYQLYAIDRFFVELIYDLKNDNLISISAFYESNKLNKYYNHIDIYLD